MGRPAASTIVGCEAGFVASNSCASISEYFGWGLSASAQSGSVIRSVWYQTTESLPASTASIHGHSTRAFAGAAIVRAVHVTPWSFEIASLIVFASGAG